MIGKSRRLTGRAILRPLRGKGKEMSMGFTSIQPGANPLGTGKRPAFATMEAVFLTDLKPRIAYKSKAQLDEKAAHIR